ncbi:hypothetical protein Tco_1091075 [Tanacetum coccineum]|uniref:Uncharacterized protein n=1 Tax=Tanacetum coccineum TaxID=301880 RepID=A0ABQ5I8C9_9ASTR
MFVYYGVLLVASFKSAGLGPETESSSPSYATLKKPLFFTRSWDSKNKWADASFVIEGIAIDDNLVPKESTDDSITSLEQLDESSISRNNADADIGPSYDSDTVFKVHHDIFENMFVHGIQNHEHHESIPDTYVVNKNNSNIIYDIPNMDPDRNKEEHDYVDNEKQRAFFASLINNLKCDVEKFENPSLLNKAKDFAPCLYNIDEIGKDSLSDHKIISEEELKCEAEKRLSKTKKISTPVSWLCIW